MSGSEILALLRTMREELRVRFGVTRIGLFGSLARGQDDAQSDIDLLVEFEHPTFDGYMDLKFSLEHSLGRPVDLVLASSVKPRLRPIIEREVVYA
jgi:hypothetical protein